MARREPRAGAPPRGTVRARLRREREQALEQRRAVPTAPDPDDRAPRPGDGGEAAGAAQASERRDISLGRRERLAPRIRRPTATLERVDGSTYGRREVCGEPIQAARLAAALPEARRCRRGRSRPEAGGEDTGAA